jgi:hypothetical protein
VPFDFHGHTRFGCGRFVAFEAGDPVRWRVGARRLAALFPG